MLQVPDTWHVINDQDMVAHGMKLGGLYKRNGNRVILLGRGNLIVRPTHLELSLFKVRPHPAEHIMYYCDCLSKLTAVLLHT